MESLQKHRTVHEQMTFQQFNAAAELPAAISPALQALWLEARGNWEKAHDLAQQAGGRDGAWVHAYLHRKEGDGMNAGYWYARAGRPAATGDFRMEWEAIARALLNEK
jgi:hypothetical protein